MRRVVLCCAVLLAGAPAISGTAPVLSAQISPGKLARPHGELEGPLRCTRCHGGGREALSRNCLACHEDIAWLIERRRGYHGTRARDNCASCHPDHAGDDFDLIAWPGGSRAGFSHADAGWELSGKHARIECEDCHTAKFRVSPAAKRSVRRRGTPWTGLETTCTSCHEDPHRAALGPKCETCHDSKTWTTTPGFDHARTRYPLTGRHGQVKCDACHAAERLALSRDRRGQVIPRYRPLAFTECSACHADPHRGRLGAACSDCHLTTGFSDLNRAGFDHDRTRYPLRGAHRQTVCERCHDFSGRSGARRLPPAFASCTDCHRDPHAGTATLAGKAVDCDQCHDLRGFAPSTYTVARHAAAPYRLAGRHATVRCEACHPRQGKSVVMRPASSRCIDCHRTDPHRGPADRDCAGCHLVGGFQPSTVDVAAHARFTFALEGAHAAVRCSACHTNMGVERRARVDTLSLTASRTCSACHKTPHGRQFESRTDKCESCHDTRAWRPAARFDHDRDARFALAGGHARVACDRCHPAAAPGADRLYRPIPRKCEDCHTSRP